MIQCIRQALWPRVNSFWEISAEELVFKKRSSSSEVQFLHFIFRLKLLGIRFQYLQVIVIFFLLKRSANLLIRHCYSSCRFPFLDFKYFNAKRFNVKCFNANSIPLFWLYILIVCINFTSSFSISVDILILSIYIRWFIFSSDFIKLSPSVYCLSASWE